MMKKSLTMLATALLTSAIVFVPVIAQESDPYQSISADQLSAKQAVLQFLQETGSTLTTPRIAGFLWQARAFLNDPRTNSGVEGAAASLIGNTLYVSHGHRLGDGGLLSTYDLATDTWTHGGAGLPSATGTQSEMAGGTALGRHYAIGGRTGPSAVLEEFDPNAGSWTTRAPMPGGARGGMGAASMAGKIYVPGGRTGGSYGGGTMLGTNEVYDAATDTWTALAPMPVPAGDTYATAGYNGRVYVFGGATTASNAISNVQIYDVATDSWSAGAPMPTARGAAMAGACAGVLVVFGGFDGATGATFSTTEIYNPVTDSWTTGPQMPFPANEIAQGMTSSGTQIFSVGTGIFGASGPVVQTLFCPNETDVPTLDARGIGTLIVILAILSALVLTRRRLA